MLYSDCAHRLDALMFRHIVRPFSSSPGLKMVKNKKKASQKSLQTKQVEDESSTLSKNHLSGPISTLSEGSNKINLLVKPSAKESRVTDISDEYVELQVGTGAVFFLAMDS